MSYVLDGKIANQEPPIRLSGKIPCAKCNKLLPMPDKVVVSSFTTKQVYNCASYIGTDYFIYESKGGTAVVYCSEYCKNKHNHRFAK
jgi:hypothetical protein